MRSLITRRNQGVRLDQRAPSQLFENFWVRMIYSTYNTLVTYLSWRGTRGKHRVHCRLDRTLVNSDWYDTFPQGRCHYLKFEGSDHRPIHCSFDAKKKKSGRTFSYDRRLKDNDEVKGIIDATWHAARSESVSKRLTRCRRAIVSWSKKHFANSHKAIVSLKDELDRAMSSTVVEDAVIAKITSDLLKAAFFGWP